MNKEKFIEIKPGLWYEVCTGLPWTSKRMLGRGKGYSYDGELKILEGKTKGGYYMVGVEGKVKIWHRLVWEFFNGKIPEGMQIDHKDNNRENNLISNLQVLSQKDNCRFCKKHKTNTSGYAGVSWNKQNNKFESKIGLDGKHIHLGLFDDPELAHQAYLAAKIKYHGSESIRSLTKGAKQ